RPPLALACVGTSHRAKDRLGRTERVRRGDPEQQFRAWVEAARLAVRIPVLGLCRTTMLHAANIADRIGVTVPLDGYFVLARHLLQSYGLQGFVSGMRSLGFDDVPLPSQVDALRPVMFERT